MFSRIFDRFALSMCCAHHVCRVTACRNYISFATTVRVICSCLVHQEGNSRADDAVSGLNAGGIAPQNNKNNIFHGTDTPAVRHRTLMTASARVRFKVQLVCSCATWKQTEEKENL